MRLVGAARAAAARAGRGGQSGLGGKPASSSSAVQARPVRSQQERMLLTQDRVLGETVSPVQPLASAGLQASVQRKIRQRETEGRESEGVAQPPNWFSNNFSHHHV